MEVTKTPFHSGEHLVCAAPMKHEGDKSRCGQLCEKNRRLSLWRFHFESPPREPIWSHSSVWEQMENATSLFFFLKVHCPFVRVPRTPTKEAWSKSQEAWLVILPLPVMSYKTMSLSVSHPFPKRNTQETVILPSYFTGLTWGLQKNLWKGRKVSLKSRNECGTSE